MIKGILAVENSFGMGKKGTLPWPKNSEDLKQFKEKTDDQIVIMGKKTWDDPCFPAPLKNRENYVISSGGPIDGAKVISGNIANIVKSIDMTSDKDVWVIGGAHVFNQLHDIIDEYHITIISKCYDCDVSFDMPLDEFERTDLSRSSDTGNYYMIYKRK